MPANTRPFRKFYPYQISDSLRQRKYAFERLSGVQPTISSQASSISSLPTAGAAQVDQIRTPGGHIIEMYQSTAQTLQPVSHATKGLVLDGDQVDNESAEYVIGGNYASNPYAMVVGTDMDSFFRVILEITDTSGSDQLMVGWRAVQTYQVPSSFLTTGDAGYTDFAAIGFAATVAAANPVNIAWDIADTGSTTVQAAGFTFADTTIQQLEVRIVGGKAMFLINGVRLGNPVTKNALGAAITSQTTVAGPVITFAAATVLVPFIFVRQGAATTVAVYLREFEVGRLVDRGLDPNNE